MTHEQKPKSAEFRTREAQVARMCQLFHFPDADALNVTSASVITRNILEAEARGAAEQRRKDAEGNRRIGYLHILLMENGQELEDFSTYDESELVFPNIDPLHSVRVEPVYTRPANVAALEARGKELEGENKAWSSAVNNALTWLENGRKANARDELRAALRRAAAIREGGE